MGKTRDVVERFYERFGANDLDGAFACLAPECIAVGLSGPLDNSAHHAAALALKKAMPDCHMEFVRIFEIDDEIYVTGRFKGTHSGDLDTPLGPVAGSGKELDLLFVDYFRVANEKIVECEVVRDRLGMMIQLGAVPAKKRRKSECLRWQLPQAARTCEATRGGCGGPDQAPHLVLPGIVGEQVSSSSSRV